MVNEASESISDKKEGVGSDRMEDPGLAHPQDASLASGDAPWSTVAVKVMGS